VGVHVVFLFKKTIKDLKLKFRKTRKVGFKQTLQNLIKAQRIVQVLFMCRKNRRGMLRDD
jgi:hypothetical protein